MEASFPHLITEKRLITQCSRVLNLWMVESSEKIQAFVKNKLLKWFSYDWKDKDNQLTLEREMNQILVQKEAFLKKELDLENQGIANTLSPKWIQLALRCNAQIFFKVLAKLPTSEHRREAYGATRKALLPTAKRLDEPKVAISQSDLILAEQLVEEAKNNLNPKDRDHFFSGFASSLVMLHYPELFDFKDRIVALVQSKTERKFIQRMEEMRGRWSDRESLF